MRLPCRAIRVELEELLIMLAFKHRPAGNYVLGIICFIKRVGKRIHLDTNPNNKNITIFPGVKLTFCFEKDQDLRKQVLKEHSRSFFSKSLNSKNESGT